MKWDRLGLPSIVLALIVVAYLLLGTAYALGTPKWQAPDEPAHFNYVVYVAENYRFPVLQMGDYPHAYLEEIKAASFPDDMSIELLRYEFHQPPLYYLLAAIVYKITSFLPLDGRVLALRLLSVVLGGVLLYAAYRLVKEIFPDDEALALGATAFVAAVPMHLALTAALNNDTLAELILVGVLWGLVRWIKEGQGVTPIGLGALIGLGLVTKTTAYVALPLAFIVIVGLHRRSVRDLGRSLAAVFWPALLLALPWWIRNVAVYGDMDFLGLGRHEAVIVGQPRTAEWLAQLGAFELVKRFLATTFRSFWAQFGWMGVLVDERIYLALALVCALVGLGFLLFVWRSGQTLSSYQKSALGLLGLSALFTLASYLWYNVQLVQHQGRYLFPALVPLGLAFALGWREVLVRERAKIIVGLFFVLLLLLAVEGFLTGDFHKWSMALLAGGLVVCGLRVLLPERYACLVQFSLYLGLFVLDAVCLFWFVIPGLT